MPNLLYSVTGHRPDKLGGYETAAFNRLTDFAVEVLQGFSNPVEITTGMALGWDLAIATACYKLAIPYTAALPCDNQSAKWTREWQDRWYNAIIHANQVVHVSREYDSQCMQRRNVWMVENTHCVLALFNGSRGGTKNCVDYAVSRKRPVIQLWDRWKVYCQSHPV